MPGARKFWISCVLLILVGFTFRFALVRNLKIEETDDGKVYSQLASNLLTQKRYSHAPEYPYGPSLIRMPGYPIFIAGVYWLFGESNDAMVHLVQAIFDTLTCALIALIAFYWQPDASRKRATAIGALALAALCPFTAIYSATVLTETLTIFLIILMCLAATRAFSSSTTGRAIRLWFITGLIAGAAVLFRPDSALFAAAVAITLVGEILRRRNTESFEGEEPLRISLRTRSLRAAMLGAVFAFALCLMLVPWTIRNRRVFHVFQPLAPRHAKMPGEFVPYGYFAWLRTWMQDQRYLGPALLKLDQAPIDVDEIPDEAFDSLEEKTEVAALFDQYSYPAGDPVTTAFSGLASELPENSAPAEAPPRKPGHEEFDLNDQEELTDEPKSAVVQDQVEESQEVKMTPEIDAAFGRLARARISRSPLRYYLSLPFRRAVSLWFDTHSQFYPFEGELMPLEELDRSTRQQIWLPLFAALTWIYTLLGVTGAWLLWRTGGFAARRWVVLVALMIFLRLGFFAALENPEPRYVVEFFPLLSILGGITMGRIVTLRIRDWYKSKTVQVQ